MDAAACGPSESLSCRAWSDNVRQIKLQPLQISAGSPRGDSIGFPFLIQLLQHFLEERPIPEAHEFSFENDRVDFSTLPVDSC